MRLHTLSPNPGSKHRRKRLGFGESSGKGKTSGKGHKGQKARSGGVVNLDNLEKIFADGATVTEAALREHGLIRGKLDGIKVLGRGELTKKLTLEVDLITASAREKIEKIGGTISIREKIVREKKKAA
jgi:large subunit ribosomal protein L15